MKSGYVVPLVVVVVVAVRSLLCVVSIVSIVTASYVISASFVAGSALHSLRFCSLFLKNYNPLLPTFQAARPIIEGAQNPLRSRLRLLQCSLFVVCVVLCAVCCGVL